jgi:hypothetical protein
MININNRIPIQGLTNIVEVNEIEEQTNSPISIHNDIHGAAH